MELLLNKKSCLLLNSISKQKGKQGINELGKNAYATYKSRWEKINTFEEYGLVYMEKLGREVIVYLSPIGKKALGYVNYILSLQKHL